MFEEKVGYLTALKGNIHPSLQRSFQNLCLLTYRMQMALCSPG